MSDWKARLGEIIDPIGYKEYTDAGPDVIQIGDSVDLYHDAIVSGMEPFSNTDDLSLTGCSVDGGYLRRSFSYSQVFLVGGTNLELSPSDSVYRGQFTTGSWHRLAVRYQIMGNGDDGSCCFRVMNNAKSAQIFTIRCGTTCNTTNNFWYTVTMTVGQKVFSPSTVYRMCVGTGDDPRAGYRHQDAASGTNNKRDSRTCPSSGSLSSTKRQYRQRMDAADFGTDTRYAEKDSAGGTTGSADIEWAKLIWTDGTDLGASGGTNDYFVSRDGGTTYRQVLSNSEFHFPIMMDEGTEGTASGYTIKPTVSSLMVSDESTIKKWGSYSLKITYLSGIGDGYATRPLTSSFVLEELRDLRLWTYRPAGHYNDTGDFITVVLMKANELDGRRANLYIHNDPSGVWTEHSLTLSGFSTNFNAGMNDTDTVEAMGFFADYPNVDYGDICYIDMHQIANADSIESTKDEFKFKVEVDQYDRGSTKRVDKVRWQYAFTFSGGG